LSGSSSREPWRKAGSWIAWIIILVLEVQNVFQRLAVVFPTGRTVNIEHAKHLRKDYSEKKFPGERSFPFGRVGAGCGVGGVWTHAASAALWPLSRGWSGG